MRLISFVSTAASLKSCILPCQEAGGLLARERQQLRQALTLAPLASLAPEIIFTTPDFPSIQTAEIVAAHLRLDGPVVITPLLNDDPQPLYFNRLLFLHARMQSLVFVLSATGIHHLAARLFGLTELPELEPGEILSLEVPGRRRQPPARIVWQTCKGVLIDPRRGLPPVPSGAGPAEFAETP